MNYLNILTEFFTFLLNFISTYIGSLLSIVVLSFLDNKIKKEVAHSPTKVCECDLP